jgi:electron transfer flavoprotein beta subunit
MTDLRTDYLELQPFAVAHIFQKVIEKEKSDLVLLGKQGIDSDSGCVGPFLAGIMGWPQVTFAAGLDVNDKGILVERETDSGTESIQVKSLPAVITCDLRLNEPRYATLPNIMKAKKKPVETLKAEDLGVDLAPHHEVLEVTEPAARKAGVTVGDVDELISKLRDEAKVIK